jgi:hypothetical protein
LGSEQSSDPYRSVHVVEAREPALASEPASCGRTGGGVLPASSAYRPWGGEGRRARPLGILKAHRRRSHCRQDLRPLHTARSFSTTVALAAASTPPRPPPGRRHRAAAVSCARTFARRAPSHSRRTAPVLMLGFGSELGVGFRAGGRAVKLGRKRRVSKREIETCRALSKRGRRRPRYIAR